MARKVEKENMDDFIEFPVKREKFCAMFSPPLPKSTFYDRVREGKITPMKQCSGYYLLNISRVRLGLPPLKQLPGGVKDRSLEDITRLAFTLIDERIFPAPPWMLTVDVVSAKDFDHAQRIAVQNRDKINMLDHVELKLAHFAGVLDALYMVNENDENSQGVKVTPVCD